MNCSYGEKAWNLLFPFDSFLKLSFILTNSRDLKIISVLDIKPSICVIQNVLFPPKYLCNSESDYLLGEKEMLVKQNFIFIVFLKCVNDIEL